MQIINGIKARLENSQGKTCIHCGKPLPSVHRSRRRADLLCFECFIGTPRGIDVLLQGDDYQPPILGGSGYAGGRLIDQIHFHHSASDSGNAASFAYYHSVVLGWGEIAYNVVITNGNGGPDGQIQFGKPDDHYPFSVGNSLNYRALAVCMVGNFDDGKSPTAAQWASLIAWLYGKSHQYAIPREKVLGHREARANSECPGCSGAMCEAIRREVFSGPAPAPIPPKPLPKEDELKILPRPQQVDPKTHVIVEADTRGATGEYFVLVCSKPNAPAGVKFDVGVQRFDAGKQGQFIGQVHVFDGPMQAHAWAIPEEFVGPLKVFSGNQNANDNFLVDVTYRP